MDLCEVWTHSLWKVREIKIQFFDNFGGVLSIDLGHAGLNTFSCLVCMMEEILDSSFLNLYFILHRYSLCHKNCSKKKRILNNHMFSEKKQGRKSILKFGEGT